MEQIREQLMTLAEKDYQKFSSKLSPTANKVLGIRVPALRKYAKEICKGDVIEFIENFQPEFHEEKMLKGIVIATAKISLQDKLRYAKQFVPLMEDWSVCDIMCNSFKFKEQELPEVFDYLLTYEYSDKEFELRFMIVMFLNYFLRKEYAKRVLEVVDHIHVDYYYTNMATAWMIAEMGYRCRDEAIHYLEKNHLDKFTQNKAIQKMQESYRICTEDKIYVKQLKK